METFSVQTKTFLWSTISLIIIKFQKIKKNVFFTVIIVNLEGVGKKRPLWLG